ncbi:MAG TPA: MarR family transcriptional regulator [Terriglobales bacterium]|nr:MarR family transcriptional regulator [Terriglobales bacterium]
MDILAALIDGVSLLSLVLVSILGWRTVQAFRQSKQAVTESASLISVIVDALTARMQHTESATHKLRTEMTNVTYRSESIETAQAEIRKSHDRLLNQLQDAFVNDKKLLAELEQLKTRLSTFQQRKPVGTEPLPKRENLGSTVTDGDILAATTGTEHEVLEILRLEGPKGAPELGIRLNKSREHTSRLMKKLYMEGYVDRETNHAPFRYKLNESLRSALESGISSVTTKAPETL